MANNNQNEVTERVILPSATPSDVPEVDFYDDTDENAHLWYVIHTYSGHENKVKVNIEKKVERYEEKIEIDFPLVNRFGEVVPTKKDEAGHDAISADGKKSYLCDMLDLIDKVQVPVHDVAVLKDGQHKIKSRKMFPGYVLVKMINTEKSWYLVRNTEGVTGFISGASSTGKSKPKPLSKEEVRRMGIEKVNIELDINVGDSIKVINGPFESFTGTVEEVNPEKETLKARISMFGRETPVELIYDQVDKIY
jgi:transcriptional antiterminator NusG